MAKTKWKHNLPLWPFYPSSRNKPDTCVEMVKQGFDYGIVPLDFIKLATLQDELYILPLTYIDGKPLILNLWLFYREDIYKFY